MRKLGLFPGTVLLYSGIVLCDDMNDKNEWTIAGVGADANSVRIGHSIYCSWTSDDVSLNGVINNKIIFDFSTNDYGFLISESFQFQYKCGNQIIIQMV